MNKYLEHPPVEAPFWDISNKLKDFGFSKGEFIKTKFTVKMSLRMLAYQPCKFSYRNLQILNVALLFSPFTL